MIVKNIIKYNGYKEPMTDLSRSLVDFMNENKTLIDKVRPIDHDCTILYIYSLQYVKTKSGRVYYTVKCDSKIITKLVRTFTIEEKPMSIFYRKFKIDNIIQQLKT